MLELAVARQRACWKYRLPASRVTPFVIHSDACVSSSLEKLEAKWGLSRTYCGATRFAAPTMQPIVVHNQLVANKQFTAIIRVSVKGIAATLLKLYVASPTRGKIVPCAET